MSDVGARHPTLCLHCCQTTVLPARFWAESGACRQISAQGLGTGKGSLGAMGAVAFLQVP